MKFRTTLLAALLLLIFGGYVYYFEIKKPAEKKTAEEKEKTVFDLTWDNVAGMTVENPHGIFVFEKAEKAEGTSSGVVQEPQWRIMEPVKTDADQTTLNSMYNALKSLKVEQVVSEEPENLSPFGLDKPLAKITVRMKEGQNPATLLVGQKSPVGYNSYAMREGDKRVLLLSTSLESQFNHNLLEFREKKLFTFQRDSIESVRIFGGGQLILELAKEGELWQVRKPFQGRASESENTDLLTKILGLRAAAFHAEEAGDLKPFGLSDPSWKIEVTLKPDQSQASLLVGSRYSDEEKAEYVYAKRGERPMVVGLRSDFLEALRQKPEEYREKKVMPIKTWEVTKLELEWKGARASLEKTEANQWRLLEPYEARADSGKVNSLLTALSRLEAEEFLAAPESEADRARYGLDAPALRVNLQKKAEQAGSEQSEKKEGSPIGTVLFGRTGEGPGHQCYALPDKDTTLYGLSCEFLDQEVPPDPDGLRDKKLLSFYRYQVDSVEWRGPEGVGRIKRAQEGWDIEKPKRGKAEGEVVNAFLDALSSLQADRFVGPRQGDLASFGLAEPEYRISIKQKEEKGEEKILGTLLFSAAGPEDDKDHLYAMTEGEGWVGLIRREDKAKVVEKLAGLTPKP